ncbi:hypothetical protein A2130_01710 [Candidatus Woesebacteria bacterium GWC2_33_12]|uniref:Uncharacterized protein n=1 Tax=Candidatus Woesebacteria bacterium GW2011_GWB1_33_22 TaxID=1618566 RepID=A0A0G0C146_9BACT|nr:MAG: hypothetical protein UR29_C0007G0060 [Candidatus Woesebacteria bacterium GW2011_GWC2_33_12]KKP42196.1 MAG: hypothetical protein UR33_C0005G0060 [Candidatus Woesebacteria bacterium GW2011_GWA2_33_20]KKP44930.1 MAG: hypothetical protein UR35_C0005G0060 [Candidatus Woesebacteria bacterium GW2011_GWB1_33_22]KKP46744.1 MAG: hypothetical protein UR37_C0005G0060 [Microgenomates group bacterium GW2011_GWC1_33_28]KKP50644.1 MAG: hypothetical protein UR41_C0005G0060 [Candidatus Woesebacteria bact
MSKTLSTDDIGGYFADAFHEVALPALNDITEKIEVLQIDMKDVKSRLGNVEERLENVEENMATKDDLEKLETTLAKRMDRMSDVQSNLIERVETLESQSPVAFA